jgi:hypothetical protein
MTRLRTAAGVDVPLRSLFQAPTVGDLASVVEALVWSADGGATIGRDEPREEIEF